MELPIKSDQILELIPQRPPIVVIDCVTGVEENYILTELAITGDSIFVDNNKFRESGMLENIAQSTSVYVGLISNKESEGSRIGYIAAMDHVIIHKLAEVGQTISTQVEIENQIMNFTIIHGRCHVGEQLIAECKMKILEV